MFLPSCKSAHVIISKAKKGLEKKVVLIQVAEILTMFMDSFFGKYAIKYVVAQP